jgi:uncharacterized protein YebE (UPF0316 family)
MTLPTGTALPVLVFLAETSVVTLSTVRTIFIARGWKRLAPLLGFFEVTIWLFAIGQVMQHLTRWDCYLAFAGGFALGNYLGVLVEQKLALGTVSVQVPTRKDGSNLVGDLRSAGYGVTSLEAEGVSGPVRVIFTVVPRKDLTAVLDLVKRFDPQAFYSVSDVQSAALCMTS